VQPAFSTRLIVETMLAPKCRNSRTSEPCAPPPSAPRADRQRRGHGPRDTTNRHLRCHAPPLLPLQRFQVLFTLLSECFSSFARATCSLSVSSPYLALDGVYRPALGCIPKQPDSTSADTIRRRRHKAPQDCHLLW
jgi:hypothetical protein